MKLAICARGEGLDSQVDQRFGRCACFVIVDPDKEKVIEFARRPGAGFRRGGGDGRAR